MVKVSTEEIGRDWAAFLQRVKAGESFVVVQAGRPVAKIAPVQKLPRALRPFGLCAGEFVVPDDFDAPLPESTLTEFNSPR